MVSVLINLSARYSEGRHLARSPAGDHHVAIFGMLPDLRIAVISLSSATRTSRRSPSSSRHSFDCHRAGQNRLFSGNEKMRPHRTKPGHEGCRVFIGTLDQVIAYFLGGGKLQNALKNGIQFEDYIPKAPDFGQVRGQKRAKEAACICAAGGHNMLMIGPPGEGKSLLASALPGILPRLTNDEKVELTRIYSAQGALEKDGVAVTRRPVRTVHHTASKQSIIGGAAEFEAGRNHDAHLGVLFLDELAEFSRATLEALRQPIEAGEIVVSRVNASFKYPSRFTLLAAMNPCPCGYFGAPTSAIANCRGEEVPKEAERPDSGSH